MRHKSPNLITRKNNPEQPAINLELKLKEVQKTYEKRPQLKLDITNGRLTIPPIIRTKFLETDPTLSPHNNSMHFHQNSQTMLDSYDQNNE